MITLVRKATEDPILAVADKLHGRLKKAVLDAVNTMKGNVDLKALADAILANDYNQALAVLGVDTGFARVLQGHGVEAGVKSLRDAIQDVYMAGAQATIGMLPEKAALEGSFDLLNPKSIEFIQSYGFNLIQQLSEEARATIRQILHRAFTEGGHPTQQAREIREAIGLTRNQEKAVSNYRKALDNQDYHDALNRALRDGRYDAGVINAQQAGKALKQARVDKMVDRYRERYVNHRATTIARTETIRAANAGQQEIWRQAAEQGVIDHKTTERVWIASGDKDTCEDCDDLDGETAELGEEFDAGVLHPPLHPNCRCTTALQFNVDKRDRVAKVDRMHTLATFLLADAIQKDWDESKHPRDERGRFGEGGGGGASAAIEGAPRGEQTYRAPVKETPFKTPLAPDRYERQNAERVINEGRDFVAKNMPGLVAASEKAQWAKNQLERVEAKLRTANRAIEKHWDLSDEQRQSPEAVAKYSKALDEVDTMMRRAGLGQAKLRAAEEEVSGHISEWLKGAAGPPRPVNADIKYFDPATAQKISDAVRKYEQLTGGASGLNDRVFFRPMPDNDKDSRAYYLPDQFGKGTVFLRPGDIRERTIIHELGHWFEDNNKDASYDTATWMKYRTAGEPLKKLDDIYPGVGYKQNEVTREDKFMNAYIGRDYGPGSSEVISMGFQYLFQKPAEFYRTDPDHFHFTLGLISQTARSMSKVVKP